jgi:hypothetical protein
VENKGRSRRRLGWLRRLAVAAVAVFALTGVTGCFGPPSGGPAPITYQVFVSTGWTASLTYSVPGGIQQEDVGTGWSKDVGYTDFAYLSAQNNGAFGSVECVLIRNGVVIVHNVSHGPYAIATCHDPY